MQEYEIFDLCIDHVQSRIDAEKPLRDTMRSSAYQHGIEMEQVRRVYEIELRDELLNRLDLPKDD